MVVKEKSNEITLSRIYDAPVKAVWEAWTDPEKAAKWWGPRGFTITTHSKDLKVGGHWHYTMHGPDGVDYPNKTVYFEVEECAKLVYDHGANDTQAPLFRVTVQFSEKDGKTTMDMRMKLATAEAAEETAKFIKKAGGNATWDRLAEYLEETRGGKQIFVINRSFNAPVEKMFEMWTNPDHLAKWLATTGSTMEFIKRDIRPGGSTFSHFVGNGIEMYARAHYLEIEKPHRIVYTQEFCDKDEKISRHPLAPTWPERMLTEVTLSPEGAEQTRVTIKWECHGDTKPEELATFVKARGGMTQGWTGSFDKLEEYLAETP